MRAVSVRQPWAWAIAWGGKDVENRGRAAPWRSAVGERIYLHASLTIDRADETEVAGLAGWGYLPIPSETTGALLATMTLADVHPYEDCQHSGAEFCSPWARWGQWHLVLADVERLLEPVPYRGALGLFEVEL